METAAAVVGALAVIAAAAGLIVSLCRLDLIRALFDGRRTRAVLAPTVAGVAVLTIVSLLLSLPGLVIPNVIAVGVLVILLALTADSWADFNRRGY